MTAEERLLKLAPIESMDVAAVNVIELTEGKIAAIEMLKATEAGQVRAAQRNDPG